MIRLPAIGAAVFALALLALPTFAMPAKEGDKLTHLDTRSQLQDVSLAEVVTTAQAQGDGTDGLPTTWCGDETGADNTANAVTPAAKAQFKVVYAYAADRANRFAGWRDALQTNVAVVQRFLSAQDGGTKALRFDMGTRCGPQYVDIQVVQLPGARAAYADNFGAISSAVQRALGPRGGTRNVDRARRRPLRLHAGVRPRRDRHGRHRRASGRREHPQPRRAHLDPLQPRRRRRSRQRPLGLVVGRLPARDDAQPRRRPVGRAALHAAGRRQLAAVRPLLAGRRRHVLRRGRRRFARDAAGLRRPARGDPAELRLRPRRLLQPGPGRGHLPRDALEHLRLRLPRALR